MNYRLLAQRSTIAFPLLLAACGSSNKDSGSDGGSSGSGGGPGWDGGVEVCQKQSNGMADGHTVTLCEEGFADPPFVRPPPDSASVVYAGLDFFAKQVVTRSGNKDAAAFLTSMAGTEAGPGANGDRYAFAIYEVTLDANQAPQSATPVILIDDAVFMKSYFFDADLEGTISKRTGMDPSGMGSTSISVLRCRFTSRSRTMSSRTRSPTTMASPTCWHRQRYRIFRAPCSEPMGRPACPR
jgi:hypothetical protein